MTKSNHSNFKRFRPLRQDAAMRSLNAEVSLSVSDFIVPLFVVEGKNMVQPIASLQGVDRLSVDQLTYKVEELVKKGYNSVLLFGVPDSNRKDLTGSSSYSIDALVPKAVKVIKANFPEVDVITDVCLCAYTQHGHCGLLKGNEIDNDSTLPHLAKMAQAHAQAGADWVAPSAMMDGQVWAIKQALVAGGYSNTEVLAYSAKFSSSFYGPFRDAANSAPSFGDRKTYQMDYRSIKQPIDEIAADIEEGALQVMVKPAMAYLDVLQRARVAFPEIPLVAYHVSGEYAMIKLAATAGYLDESAAFREAFTAIKRAGANRIISYFTDSSLFG